MSNFNTQEEAEQYWKDEGWDIIKPQPYRDGTCQHKWQKIAENDYQCACGKGFIGNPYENA